MNSEKPDQQQPPELLTPSQARQVEAKVVEPDKKAQQELVELEHTHAQKTQKAELGWIGRILGSRQEKPGNVAFLVIVFCFLFLFLAYYKISNLPPDPVQAVQAAVISTNLSPGGLSEQFFKLVSSMLGVIGLALGYLFGSNNKN